MNKNWIRIINLLLIAGILLGYNATLKNRSQAEEIAKLQAELEISKLRVSKEEEQQNSENNLNNSGSAYLDGVYVAGAQGFGGEITVEVTIENGIITKLDIISAAHEDRAYLEAASVIVKEMLEKQTAQVDTVSGATYSSTGIRDAAAAALEKAKKEQ